VRAVVSGAGAGQKLVRPWFGAQGDSVPAERASALGLSRPVGVLVRDVHEGSPAERAGIRRGDVLLSVEGREVQDMEALRFRIATHAVGQSVSIGLVREGRELRVPATLVAPPETPARDTTELRGRHPLSGAVVANLSPALADELMLDFEARGVVVVEVVRETPAHRLGVQPGDVLLRLGDRELRGTDDVRRAIATPLPWRMQVRRGERVLPTIVAR
jgi:serine protease Do